MASSEPYYSCPPPETKPEEGTFQWHDWEKCSQTCSIDGKCGVEVRYAKSCQPADAICSGIQIQRKDCNCQSCPPGG